MVLISRLCRFIRLGMGFRVWGIGIILAFGCSSHERDNPTDPIHVYKVTFNASEATGGTPPAAMTGSYGDVIQLPDGGSLERAEYAFGGWGVYSHTITGDTAMNAVWIPVYTVTFNTNGATSGTAPTAMKASSGSYILLPDGNLEKTGYVFGGWSISSSYNRSVDGLYGYTVSNNTTFYANWIPFRTVAFDANGATSGAPPADLKVIDGSEVRYSDIGTGTMEKPGYVFGCWGNANDTKCYSSSYTRVIYDIKLYAIWLPIYTVTFDANGATSGTVTAMKTPSGSTIQLPDMGTLRKTDYVFTGWNTNSSGTGDSYNIGSSYAVSNDTTLYAMWHSCPGYNSEETHICDERDWQAYRITTIGTQTWLAENLNYDITGGVCYGDGIPNYISGTLPNNEVQANCDTYGRLYNWNTAMNVCPEGWHLPSQVEWNVLGDDATKLKATSGWNSNGNGSDEYGFSALPGGYCIGGGCSGDISGGSFDDIGNIGHWWSSSLYHTSPYYRIMGYNLSWDFSGGSNLRSVRCVKNN